MLAVEPHELENKTPGSIDPTGLWRLLFWLVFVLGSLSLLFSWLLAQIPGRPHGAELLPHYISRLCAALFMLVSIVMARRIWKVTQGGRGAMQIVQLIAWVELIIAACGIVGIAVSRH
jgi:hypothetical protein